MLRDAHHLRGMLDESAAPRVMIITRRGRPPEPITPFFQERLTQSAQSRIANCLDRLQNKIPSRRLFGAQICGALQQFVFFLIGQRAHGPFARFEPVLWVPVKLAREFDKMIGRKRATCFVSRVIAPNAQRHPIARVGEGKLAVRLLLARQPGRCAFDLHVHARGNRAGFGGSPDFCERH